MRLSVVAAALLPLTVAAEPCRPLKAPPKGAITASWYGEERHGRITASGERFDEHQLTAAHPWLPLRMLVRVTNLLNGRAVDVRIMDRGPGYGRGIDLSQAAAEALGMRQCGLAYVLLTPGLQRH
jgi:rare lipoprotein A